MPTERFYRLAKEKQESIGRAAFEEFASVPLDKVSINRIIQKADISRGSFYTYFEDKTDLLHYILRDIAMQVAAFFKREMAECGGDIFRVLERFCGASLEACSRGDWFAFSHNVMRYLNPDEVFGKTGIREEESGCEIQEYLFAHTDRTSFRFQAQKDFDAFLELAVAALMVTMRKLYDGASAEELRMDYHRKLELLKLGVCI